MPLITTRNVYITIDKDVLSHSDALTNWDQGKMPLDALLSALRHILAHHHAVGIDVNGDYSRPHYTGKFRHVALKKLEALLDQPRQSKPAITHKADRHQPAEQSGPARLHQRGSMTILLVGLAVSIEIIRELCLKLGSNRSSRAWVGLGIGLWAVVVVWIRVLQLVPLSVAFPMMSLCYAGLPLLSRSLKEAITKRQWIGIVHLITLGVAGIGMSGIG